MAVGDKDLDFKLRMSAILWKLGYYTKIDVKLASHSEYTNHRRRPKWMELTDIDVLGVRFDPDYTTSYAAADCTTRTSLGPVARTFWLRGVMDHFQADRGYEVLSKPLSAYEKQVASNLGITLLNENSLQALEERYHSSKKPLRVRLNSLDTYNYLTTNIGNVNSKLKPLVGYQKYSFWQNPSNRNILSAISSVRRVRKWFNPSQKFERIVLLETLTLFSIAFLEVCGALFRTTPENILEALRSYLFGGPLAIQAKETLLREIQTLVKTLNVQPSSLSEETMRRLSLDPEYLPALSDMAQRFISKPAEAVEVPRYLQAIMIERTLVDDGNSLKDIFAGQYSDVTLKFVHDLAYFFQRATGVGSGMFQDLEKD